MIAVPKKFSDNFDIFSVGAPKAVNFYSRDTHCKQGYRWQFIGKENGMSWYLCEGGAHWCYKQLREKKKQEAYKIHNGQIVPASQAKDPEDVPII